MKTADHVLRAAYSAGNCAGRSLPAEPVLSDYIGHQPFLSLRVFASKDDDVAHGRMLAQHCFKLSEFDTEATDFYLVVRTAEEFDPSVGQIARQISGFVQPPSELVRKRGLV